MSNTTSQQLQPATELSWPGRASRPKIAYIMSRFPKISETFILFEILELERQGLPVEIYPLLREHQPVTHPEAEKMIRRAHFHPFLSLAILRANFHYLFARPRRYFGMIAEVLRGTFGSMNFFAGAIGILPKAVRFAYEMERQGIAHVHAHFCNHPAVAALIIHRLTGIPFSFTAHGSDLHKDQRMLDRKVEAATYALTVSRYNKEVMIKKCGEPARNKIHIIHCGVDPEVFTLASEKKPEGPLRVVCVASLEEVKGHKYLVAACQKLVERGIDFRCDLVGDGPLRMDLENQIKQAKLEDKIIVHGSLRRMEVVSLLRSADVAVLSSVPTASGKREGIPVALMEAMACGLPVVSSQLSGIPELVENERSGILVPPRDAVALADALFRLSQDAELRQRMGRAGRDTVLREFNQHANVAQLASLFSSTVKPTAGPRGASNTHH